MGENELTRKVFSTIGKASGASQEEIIEATKFSFSMV